MDPEKNNLTSISGVLNPGHFLRDIFPTGLVPLMSPNPIPAVLGPNDSPSQMVYMCRVKSLSPEQLRKIAIIMGSQSDSTIQECLAHLMTVDAIPFRIVYFTGVLMPLKFFI